MGWSLGWKRRWTVNPVIRMEWRFDSSSPHIHYFVKTNFFAYLCVKYIYLMKAYFWKNKQNFGDRLTPLLLSRFANINVEWSTANASDIVVVGSILEQLPRDYKGIILGSGKLHSKTIVDFPEANILALRGPLTAKGVKGNFVLGDAGLLADELIPVQERIHNLGIVAHWTDRTLEFDSRFSKYNPKIIHVTDDPIDVITQIAQCKKIISSSLHGIILADALGIPRRIEIAPRMLSHAHQEGGLFKWQDYSASIDEELVIGVTKEINHNKIEEKQHELFDVFEELRSIINKVSNA